MAVPLATIDVLIITGYLVLVAALGFWIHRRATRGVAAFYLGDRSLPWWVLGLAGCSSYIDIGGTMGMVGLMYWTGLQSVWLTHVFWGWFIICFYMAFQAKWIRRSGVMTFAEWNRTRFGDGRDTEIARTAAAVFLLVLMVFNLTFIAVGIRKFAAEFLPVVSPHVATLVVFAVVGLYTTLGGFFGVVLTDVVQTVLIAIAAVGLAVLAIQAGDPAPLVEARDAGWSSLQPAWNLWEGYGTEAGGTYFEKFGAFGPLMLAGFGWLVFRVLAGPNVWDFQFFLTARSPRDAALAGGVWTYGYTLRWIIGASFCVLGMHQLAAVEAAGTFDSESIMPRVLAGLEPGLRGVFVALLLAALMSTLDAMVNVTSSAVVNDVLRRSVLRHAPERTLVRAGQIASVVALLLAFALSFGFDAISGAWETMIFSVVTVILVPATLRWHWWRFSAKAFTWGMVGTALWVTLLVLIDDRDTVRLPASILGSLVLCLVLGWRMAPSPRDVLVTFYTSIRPFGVWGPVRRDAVARGLVPARDPQPALDVLNGFLCMGLQVGLCIVPFAALFRMVELAAAGLVVVAVLSAVLWRSWYRTLPPREA